MLKNLAGESDLNLKTLLKRVSSVYTDEILMSSRRAIVESQRKRELGGRGLRSGYHRHSPFIRALMPANGI